MRPGAMILRRDEVDPSDAEPADVSPALVLSLSLSAYTVVLPLTGVADLVADVPKGSGCNEQTSRASTPTHLRRAQKSCALRSWDPERVVAAFTKSCFSTGENSSSMALIC